MKTKTGPKPELMDCQIEDNRYRFSQLFEFLDASIETAREYSNSIIAQDEKHWPDPSLGWLHDLITQYRDQEGPTEPSVGIFEDRDVGEAWMFSGIASGCIIPGGCAFHGLYPPWMGKKCCPKCYQEED